MSNDESDLARAAPAPPSPAQEENTMQVSEKDRDNARSAVVSAYHSLDCVSIPVAFLHAFADAAVGALSTDADPVGWFNPWNDYHGYQQVAKEYEGKPGTVPLYAGPVKTAPAVAVKAELTPESYVYEFIENGERSVTPLPAWEKPYQDAGIIAAAERAGYIWIGGNVGCDITVTPHGRTAAELHKARSALSAQVQDVAGLEDKIEGLEADLDNAIEVAFKRGATEWVRLNYPKHYERFSASPASKHGDAE